MRRFLLGFFLLTIFTDFSFGQSLPEVIKPSPEAASLGKYGETPVSLYTGVPNIEIPLYTIHEGDLSLPISLNYHAGGIKVEEESDWVGLGWSLMANGSITRSIRGFDDFQHESYKGYYYNQYIPDGFEDGTPYQDFEGPLTGLGYDEYMLLKDGVYKNYSTYLNWTNVDWESDLYYFNLNGISGTFVLDESKKPTLVSHQKLDIEFSESDLGWTIRDDKGYTYTFGSSQTSFSEMQETITAWYVTKMESPCGNSITFEYDKTQGYTIKSIPSYTENKFNVLTSDLSPILTGGAGGCTGDLEDIHTSPPSLCQMHYLRTIKFTNGYVRFLRNSDFPEMEGRLDLIGAEKLVAVQIYKRNNDSDTPTLKREFTLDHDYFSGGEGLGYQNKFLIYYPEFNTDKLSKRLKLVSVKECGENNICSSPYIFKYNETIDLPSKASFSRDFWGYANGVSNSQLVPEHSGAYNTENGLEQLYFFGADRSPSDEHAQANLLKMMIYPTGGYTKYTYHINEYSNLEKAEYKTVKYGPYYFDQGKSHNTGDITFTVKNQSSVSFRFEIHGNDYVFDSRYFYVALTDIETWNLVNVQGNIKTGGANYYIYKLTLPAGTYTLTSNLPKDGTEKVTIRVAVTWGEVNLSAPVTHKAGGGVRVEKIEDYDPETKHTNVRTFNYDNTDGSSSGILMSYPRFVRKVSSEDCNVIIRSSTSNLPLSVSGGGLVGYSKVTVGYGDNTENGKTEYYYHNKADFEKHNDRRMPNIPTFNDIQNGNLLRRVDFAVINGAYKKVKEVINQFKIEGTPLKAVWNMNIKKYYSHLSINPAYNPNQPTNIPKYIPVYEFWVAHYGTVSNWNRLVSETTKTYDPRDQNQFEEAIKLYEYGNMVHLNPTRITATDSKGITITTDTKYPADFTGSDYGSDILRDKFIHNQPLVQTVDRDSKITSKQATTYKLDQNHPVVDVVQTAPSGGDLETRITFHKYDAYGNILELSKSDDIHIVYLWGYNNSNPVAEIKNATYREIVNVLGQTVIDALNTNPGTDEQMRILLKPLRESTALKKAQVTTFTYDPLVGITSSTDPSGITSYFEYDGLGRLKLVRDNNNKIVKDLFYHYKQ